MRDFNIDEHYKTAEACSRMFPEPKWSYLRSALSAATILTTAKALTPREREHYERVKAVNVGLYRRETTR